MAPWVVPEHARLAGAVAWLLGPYVAGRPTDLRVLRLDADADDAHDATAALGGIRCPTLVVSGGRDLAYPPDLTRELVAGHPDVRATSNTQMPVTAEAPASRRTPAPSSGRPAQRFSTEVA